MNDVLNTLLGVVLGFVLGLVAQRFAERRLRKSEHQDAAWHLFVALERVSDSDHYLVHATMGGRDDGEDYARSNAARAALDRAVSKYLQTSPVGDEGRQALRVAMLCEYVATPVLARSSGHRNPAEITDLVIDELVALHPSLESFAKLRTQLRDEVRTFVRHEFS